MRHLTGVAVAIMAALIPIGEAADMTNIGTLFAFVLVCIGIIVLRYTNPDPSVSMPFMPGHSHFGCARLLGINVFPPLDDLDPDFFGGRSSAFWSTPRTALRYSKLARRPAVEHAVTLGAHGPIA